MAARTAHDTQNVDRAEDRGRVDATDVSGVGGSGSAGWGGGKAVHEPHRASLQVQGGALNPLALAYKTPEGRKTNGLHAVLVKNPRVQSHSTLRYDTFKQGSSPDAKGTQSSSVPLVSAPLSCCCGFDCSSCPSSFCPRVLWTILTTAPCVAWKRIPPPLLWARPI